MATFCEEKFLTRENYMGKEVPVYVSFIEESKGNFGRQYELEIIEQDSAVFGSTSIFADNKSTKKLIQKFGPVEQWKNVSMVITARKYLKGDNTEGVKLLFGW